MLESTIFIQNETQKALEGFLTYQNGYDAALSEIGIFVYVIPILLLLNILFRNWYMSKHPDKLMWEGNRIFAPVYRNQTISEGLVTIAFLCSVYLAATFYLGSSVLRLGI